ncbi:GTP cyclohydrolase FolE2 [Marinomonas gallaica]|uniref:GTP cyclohydrolase FolE2 n=1 Tax=Marinomonas gallaica TaxID=1806667 RepID=UPI003A918908
MNIASQLPDVAHDCASNIPIDRVGMSGVALPIELKVDGQTVACAATASIFANVQNDQKGLHMSRMYRTLLDLSSTPLTASTLEQCARTALAQQQEVHATELSLHVSTLVQLKRPALHSAGWGWNAYPVELALTYSDAQGVRLTQAVTVTYSSSCPASAALSRQALSSAFVDHAETQSEPLSTAQVAQWLEQSGTLAIPHSQRSDAMITIDINSAELPVFEVIELSENALETAVQTYVKREDEQQFALRNGANPMFVEDASRRLMGALKSAQYSGHVSVTHRESLHGHDAVAHSSFTKGELV